MKYSYLGWSVFRVISISSSSARYFVVFVCVFSCPHYLSVPFRFHIEKVSSRKWIVFPNCAKLAEIRAAAVNIAALLALKREKGAKTNSGLVFPIKINTRLSSWILPPATCWATQAPRKQSSFSSRFSSLAASDKPHWLTTTTGRQKKITPPDSIRSQGQIRTIGRQFPVYCPDLSCQGFTDQGNFTGETFKRKFFVGLFCFCCPKFSVGFFIKMNATTIPAAILAPFVDLGSASTGFITLSAALVFLMMPGLGLFYSGLSRYNNALSLVMLCMLAMAVVTLQFFLFGFSLAFSESGGPFIGDLNEGALNTLGDRAFPNTAPQIPSMAFMLFQMQFATIR